MHWTRAVLEGFDGKPLFLDWARLGHASPASSASSNVPFPGSSSSSSSSSNSSGSGNGSGNGSGSGSVGDSSPIIVVLHGVSGTSTDGYLQRFAGLCLERRWRVVSFDYWRLDYADCRDLDGAIKYLHRQYPSAPIVPVAFSAGGHLLVRYLSTVGRDTPIVAAATVSACGDLMEEYRRVCKQENSSYRRYLNSGKRQKDREAERQRDREMDIERSLVSSSPIRPSLFTIPSRLSPPSYAPTRHPALARACPNTPPSSAERAS